MSDTFTRVYNEFFRSGLAAELGPQRSLTLLAIASYMDENGEAFPSQETLAGDLGMARQTVVKWVNSLLEFRFNGEPVIERELIRVEGAKFRHNKYKISPVAQLAKFSGVLEDAPKSDSVTPNNDSVGVKSDTNNKQVITDPTDIKDNTGNGSTGITKGKRPDADLANFEIKNSSDVCKYFAGRYFEKYEVPYVVNYAREASMVKSKLWGAYTPEQLRAIIDLVMAEYDTRWASRDYPRPTIGQLCSWLANKAIALVQGRGKDRAELEEIERKAREQGAKLEDLERWFS